MYKITLFKDWVPRWLQIIYIFMIWIGLCTSPGVFLGLINNITGSFAILPQDANMANVMFYSGIAVAFPMAPWTNRFFRARDLMLGSLLAIIFCNLLCVTTDSAGLLILLSFILGFLRVFAIIVIFGPLMQLVSPNGDRPKFYAVFYTGLIGMGQVFDYLFVEITQLKTWQDSYIYPSIYLSVGMLTSYILIHGYRSSRKVPLHRFDWPGIMLFTISLSSMAYTCTYSRTEDWFNSEKIQFGTVLFIISTILFFYRELSARRPYIPICTFQAFSIRSGLVILFACCLFFGSFFIQTAFTSNILGYNYVTNAKLNLPLVAGLITGSIICVIWYKAKFRLKPLLLGGVSLIIIYHYGLYNLFATQIDFEQLFLPIFFKGTGLIILYIALAVYIMDKAVPANFLSIISIIAVARSIAGPTISTAILNWVAYNVQWQTANDLSNHLNSLTLNADGMTAFQMQTMLISYKKVFGYIVVAGIALLLFIGIHPFVKTGYRRLILIRNMMGLKYIPLRQKSK